jgi:uncharacterized protein YyaL (SSP411 family)
MFHFRNGAPQVTGLLTDQVTVAAAMLEAYQATGGRQHLERAVELAQVIERDYLDAENAGFFDVRASHDRLGNLQFRTKNIEENAGAAALFQQLAAATGQAQYGRLAESALRAFAADYPHYGYFASGFARAVIRSNRPALDAHVVGDPAAPATRALLWAVLRLPEPALSVQVLDPAADADALNDLGYPPQPSPTVYLCHNGACSAPVQAPAELAAALQGLASPFRAL